MKKEKMEEDNLTRNDQQKESLRKNAVWHIKVLKAMKKILEEKNDQQMKSMARIVSNSGTNVFMTEVLDIDSTIEIQIEPLLLNPIWAMDTILEEIINMAIRSAHQKIREGLTEENLNYLMRDPSSRYEKNVAKKKKKKQYDPPKPNVTTTSADKKEK